MSERKMPSVEDFPSNAIGAKEESKDLPSVKVRHKRSVWKSVGDRFISEDAEYIGTSILDDILIPALKDLINDILHGAVDMTFGGGGNYSRGSRRGRGSYISYNRMYSDRPSGRRRRSQYDDEDDDYDRPSRRKRLPDGSDYIFDPRDFDRPSDAKRAADDLLDMMADRIEEYGEVTVAWFFDRVGEDVGWNAEDWGWTSLAGVKVRGNSRNGWYIDLPRPKEL